MKYWVTIEGVEREIDVQLSDGRVLVDGESIEIDSIRVPGGLSFRLGGCVYDVAVGGPTDALSIAQGGHRVTARVEGERGRARRRRGAKDGVSAKELRAPMPGRIVKVLVAAGKNVAAGDPLVVIEAMKMENELRSAGEGVVKAVAVTEGSSVESNALLVTFE